MERISCILSQCIHARQQAQLKSHPRINSPSLHYSNSTSCLPFPAVSSLALCIDNRSSCRSHEQASETGSSDACNCSTALEKIHISKVNSCPRPYSLKPCTAQKGQSCFLWKYTTLAMESVSDRPLPSRVLHLLQPPAQGESYTFLLLASLFHHFPCLRGSRTSKNYLAPSSTQCTITTIPPPQIPSQLYEISSHLDTRAEMILLKGKVVYQPQAGERAKADSSRSLLGLLPLCSVTDNLHHQLFKAD